ncbi:DUF3157 family protein [Leptospira idonii]|uniref:DUF3157 family protein n=1 Tax=Leptospira idonii TaxID=1193500 RepID=UPI001FEB806E|nr:DUF3157 family protein [Leptospira idonii]
MKRCLKHSVLIVLLLFGSSVFGEDAYTKTGKKVILNDDFTWKYAESAVVDLNTNMRKLERSSDHTSVLVSKYNTYSVYYNPANWFNAKASNEAAEFGFENTRKTSYSMLIYEGVEIPLETFPNLILENTKNVDPTAYIIDIEDVSVNGMAGKIVKYHASSKGLNFIFYSFLTSGKFGSIHFIAFTLESNFDRELEGFDSLISGLVVNK